MKTVAIIAPTFNEEESIEKFIASVRSQRKKLPNFQQEIVISDSHSKDSTGGKVRKMARKNKHIHLVDSQPGPGKLGVGLTKGLDFAVNALHADYLVTLEADLTEDPNLIPAFVKKLSTHDVVIGSRYAPGGKILNWTWWRRGLSLGANFTLGAFAFNWHIHEYTNLYRAFRKEVWLEIRPKVSLHQGWLFVPAFVFEALERGYKIIEEPIVYSDRLGGQSKMNTLSYGRNLLRYAISFRARKILGR